MTGVITDNVSVTYIGEDCIFDIWRSANQLILKYGSKQLHEVLVLVAHLSSEGSDYPAQMRGFGGAFAARTHIIDMNSHRIYPDFWRSAHWVLWQDCADEQSQPSLFTFVIKYRNVKNKVSYFSIKWFYFYPRMTPLLHAANGTEQNRTFPLKQLGPRSGLIKMFDTLVVFLKDLFWKGQLKISANDHLKSMQNFPACDHI